MFRIGGSAGTGITSGLDKPRQRWIHDRALVTHLDLSINLEEKT